ncbi:MAG TPA: hypothetical protein VIB48_12995 [Acidimicrobiia bacterium]|jgi:hypothetical protein
MAQTIETTQGASPELREDGSAPAAAAGAPRLLDNRAWLLGRIDGRLAAAVGIGWYVLFGIGQALEPAPTNPNAVPAWIETAVSAVLLATFAAMIPGLITRRRWGVVAAVAAGLVYVAATIACPTTGHHEFGLWWLGEMGCASTLLAGSVYALRRS